MAYFFLQIWFWLYLPTSLISGLIGVLAFRKKGCCYCYEFIILLVVPYVIWCIAFYLRADVGAKDWGNLWETIALGVCAGPYCLFRGVSRLSQSASIAIGFSVLIGMAILLGCLTPTIAGE